MPIESPSPSAAGSLRVLLVDDDRAELEHLAWTFRLAGYEVEEAPSAEQALARLDVGSPPDLVLSDIRMPGMSGCELARLVIPRGIRVILYSASAAELAEAAATQTGALAYVGNPFELVDAQRLIAGLRRQGGEDVPIGSRSPSDWTACLDRAGDARIHCGTEGQILKDTRAARQLLGWTRVPRSILDRSEVKTEEPFVIVLDGGISVGLQVLAMPATSTEPPGYLIKAWPEQRGLVSVLKSAGFSPRLVEVCQLLLDGLTEKETAERLQISPATVHHHRESVRLLLRVRRVRDVRHALQRLSQASPQRPKSG